MYEIKAIETKYKGCRFRSRLEARYAVFFDKLGIEWQYEPEGFELGYLGRYLPDFYLPEINMWAEVKAKPFNVAERAKAFALSSGTDMPVIQLVAIPEPSLSALCAVELAIGARMPSYEQYFAARDLVEWYLSVNNLTKTESSLAKALAWDVEYHKRRHGKPHPRHFPNGMMVDACVFDVPNSKRMEAVRAARSARFDSVEFACS